MSCYSQGDFSSSSSSKMTFPKPSACWSVSLISCFQNSKRSKTGSRCLSEGVRCWWKWKQCHSRGFLSKFRPAGTSLMWQSLPALPGRKGRCPCVSFLFRDVSWISDRASCMLDNRPKADIQTERGAGLEGGQQYPFWEGDLNRRAAQWLDGWIQFPDFRCVYKKGAAQEATSWKFTLQRPLTTFPPTVDFLVKTESFVKKLRLFLLQFLWFL